MTILDYYQGASHNLPLLIFHKVGRQRLPAALLVRKQKLTKVDFVARGVRYALQTSNHQLCICT